MIHWEPTASVEILQKRAKFMDEIRAFFRARDVLEVETPLLAKAPVTDPYIDAFSTHCRLVNQTLYLQTSPEYAMKRLIAAGVGSCFQICKAFREDEAGRLHHPEFTMLEWYRLGFDEFDLMDEVDALMQNVLGFLPAHRLSYREAFIQYVGVDPHGASTEQLIQRYESEFGQVQSAEPLTRDDWLMLLFGRALEPKLLGRSPFFIHDFPASQAALARVKTVDGYEVASRVEVYAEGIELGNGYYELTDPRIQRERFQADLAVRQSLGRPKVPVDEALLAALEAGLPECAGIAMGLDRLLMLALKRSRLREVMSFSLESLESLQTAFQAGLNKGV